MTDAERLLWSRIRQNQLKGFQFYRQKIIGNYIVDFYCPNPPKSPFDKGGLRGIKEVDGGQHYIAEGKDKDHIRNDYMKKIGINVLRFSDRDVLKRIDAVMEKIWREL